MELFRDKLYQFLSDHLNQHGYSPSFAEITHAMGISPRSKSLITRNLKLLEKEKRIRLVKEGRRLVISLVNRHIPLLGGISAGTPIEAITDMDYLDLENLFQGTDRFALLVKGNSMKDEGILEGDVIICRQMVRAKEGEIVVALIDQKDVTLKRISYRLKNMITLIPANAELSPKTYAPERIQIQGIYLGLVRANR